MNAIAKERRVWRELTQNHFTPAQIECVLKERPELAVAEEDKVSQTDTLRRQRSTVTICLHFLQEWKQLYKMLRWKFGLREEYTETLTLCRKCSVLFWRSIGHPCVKVANSEQQEENEEEDQQRFFHVDVSPQAFLSFFSV